MADDFDGDFDAEKAKRLIENLRADKAALKADKAALAEQLDSLKGENDSLSKDLKKAQSDAESAQQTLAADRRVAILKEFSISDEDAEEFLPTTLATDELRRKAERLSGRLQKEAESAEGTAETGEPVVSEPVVNGAVLNTRPKAALVNGSGALPTAQIDTAAIAAAARRR